MSEELLSASGEAAWQSLRQHIEWTPGFWIGWVFTDHTPSVHELHQRIEGQLQVVGRGAVIQQPREPGELVAVLAWLLAGADGCDGCVTVAVVRQEEAWQAAWDQFLLRLNERRELLREQLRAGLLLCAPTKFKPRSREAAPDLWSIRSLALDVAPIASSGPHLITLREHVPDNPPGSPEAVTLALQAVAAAQRAGQTDAEGKARIRAAQALFAVGRRDEGREQAVYAVEAAPSPALQARSLVVLADLERELGDLVAAERHYKRAIAVDAATIGITAYRNLAQLLLRRGALDEARSVAERGLTLSGEQRARAGDTADALHMEGTSLDQLGDVLEAQGDLNGARAAYERGLALKRRIHAMVGDTAEALRAVAVSLERFGGMLQAQGDLSGAGVAYDEALGLVRRSRAIAGDTPGVLRGEMLGLLRVGEVLRAQGDLREAGAAYQEGLALTRQIRRMIGDTAESLRDYMLSLDRLGDVLRAQGDLSGARVVFEEALGLSRRVQGIVGDTAEALRDVSVTLNQLGDVLAAERDWIGAQAAYGEGLALGRRIHEMVGDTVQAVEDLASFLHRCAAVHVYPGRLAESRGELLEAAELLRQLQARGGGSSRVPEMLTLTLEALADLREEEARLRGEEDPLLGD